MSRINRYAYILIFVCAVLPLGTVHSAEISPENCMYLSSQHFTTDGMKHWYSKENGGLETLTGIPYDELTCKNCHAASCDSCHLVKKDGKSHYETTPAQMQETCFNCHGREKAVFAVDKAADQVDVHTAAGMKCMDCHTKTEVHGDGTHYNSMKQPGFMAAQCENCHQELSQIASHAVHNGKLDCKACHLRQVVSCSNCHFDTLLKTGQRKAIKLHDWIFLMNYNGKVSSANMQTFVVEDNKTFMMFAPQNSHSVMKQGRECGACHATKTVKAIKKGKIDLITRENGQVVNVKGVIPVVDGVDYNCVYHSYEDGKWIPIEKPEKPLIHYAAYGTPLTAEQLKKMAKSEKN